VLAYFGSLCVLVLQLLAFSGGEIGYGLFVFLHGVIYWVAALRHRWLGDRFELSISLVAGAFLGSIPFAPIVHLGAAAYLGEPYAFSSLTRDQPMLVRVAYESLTFPLIQIAIVVVASRIGRGVAAKAGQRAAA
jgi:hypothetical protein